MSDHLNPGNVQQRLDKAADAGKITSARQMASFDTQLLDSEVQAAMRVVVSCQRRYARLSNTPANLDKLRDEVLTRLADIGVLATFDPTPCFYGEPPMVEFVGRVGGHSIHSDGFDHEQKRYEVQKAHKRGEYYLGEKERVNTRKLKDSK